MREKIQIRPVTLQDVQILKETARQTFYDAFHDTNTPENLRAYLHESFSVERLTEELINPLSRFYFALVNDEVAGYLKVNEGSAQTEFQHDQWFEVERIYIMKQYWGQSIGQTLLDFALKQATEQKCTTVWLGVWERNYRALRFYQKNGFQPFSRHIFQVGDDPQWDILMKKEIYNLMKIYHNE
jgi:ribosomal protein S18 acetylase RimI-like enzyme